MELGASSLGYLDSQRGMNGFLSSHYNIIVLINLISQYLTPFTQGVRFDKAVYYDPVWW